MNHRAPRRAARLVAVIAGLAAASLVLGGCLYSMIPDTGPIPSASPDTTDVAADLLPYYQQHLDWKNCGGLDCTMVRAPLDWSDPSAGDIELSINRHRADSGHAIGSLLTNPGGPGVSGVERVRDSLDSTVGKPLRQSYDVIGFDPRGVGQSTAVTCYDTAEMDSYLFDIPKNPRGSDAWTAEVTEQSRAFGEACAANSNGILPYITTENAARDLDLIRGVLGDRQLNYLGYSYGTLLGATYAGLYPERVGRMVLDGALDPSSSRLEVGATQTIGFESALRAYMKDCLTRDGCPFRGSVDDALADLGTLLASVDKDPLPASDGRLLGANSLNTGISLALYSQSLWPVLTKALTDTLAGNPDSMFRLVDFYYNRQNGKYVDNQTEAFSTYTCMDYPLSTPAEQAAADALVAQKAPTIAPYWTGPDPCAVWPYPSTRVPAKISADGAAPIVVVGTTNDPATPYKWAVSLADQLSSGVLVTRVGEGHTGYNQSNACVNNAVEGYLVDGTVPKDGTRC